MTPGLYKMFSERWEGQTLWVISDTHFADADLHEGRPDRISDEDLVKAINSKVGRKDVLIHLGDCGDPSFIKRLRGYKILIMGNHDGGVSNYQRTFTSKIFDMDKYTKEEALNDMKELYPDCSYSIDDGYQFSRPFEYWKITADNKLFDEIYEGPLMIGEKLLLSHEPINQQFALNIHGHNHAQAASDIYHKNVCVDVFGPEPLNLTQFMKAGPTAHIESIHRQTIDTATERKRRRGNKKVWER